jgi:hypothetical protein
MQGASVTDVSERAEVLQPDLVSLNADTNILDEHIPLDVDDMRFVIEEKVNCCCRSLCILYFVW